MPRARYPLHLSPRISTDGHGKFLAFTDLAVYKLMLAEALPEVYSTRDIARAAGVSEARVRDLIDRGEITRLTDVPGRFSRARTWVAHRDAVRAVRTLQGGIQKVEEPAAEGVRRLLSPTPDRPRSTTVPLIVSTSLHGLVVVLLLVITSQGLTNADEKTDAVEPVQQARLVFLARPGPGGGGGGGGLRMRTPPPKAQRKGPQALSSPIPARRPPPPPTPPPPKPVEPPPTPLEAKVLPPVMAPVAPVAADPRNNEGQLKEVPAEAPPSQGSGQGGGTGTGQGTGIGEGKGGGIGEGEGGGIGGGPYRPGSGVDPPRLLREVRADYTDQARRANIAGEVVLEIVVRRDGTVGDVKILQRLGSGLDQNAIQAVRQWRFAPARMKGTPVDVIVEVAVEFKLR